MNRKDLLWCLGFQVFSALFAGLSFAMISNKVLAGLVAGSCFLLTQGMMLLWAWRWKDKWQSCAFYLIALQLLAVSIPMIVVRLSDTEKPFADLTVYGLSGPEFHKLSTNVFTVLVVATVIDLVRVELRHRRSSKASV